MAQKWNNHTPDVYSGFTNTGTSQLENGTMPMISPGSGSSQMHIVSPPHMMHVGNSFIIPSDAIKTNCIRNSECSITQNNDYHAADLSDSCTSTEPQLSDSVQDRRDNSVHSISESPSQLVCFVCSTAIEGKNYSSIKSTMNHSGAPCLVLLTDVLGYKFDDAKLHSQVICKSCVHLLDIIDELQQTLTESKTDVRTKFLETVQCMKLKYPRTDKMLKPRCLRCIQMAQSVARKKTRGGRLSRGRAADDVSRLRAVSRDKNAEQIDNSGGIQQTDAVCNDPQNMHTEEADSEIDVDSVTVDDRQSSDSSCQSINPMTRDATSDISVFDTDPAFFSPDEKVKVGTLKTAEGIQTYHCIYCSDRYDSALRLKMHVRVFHMPVLVYDNGQGTPETKYRMGIKLQNTNATELSATEKPFACLFCESAYKLQSSLQSHFRENHSPHKPFQCLECKDSFRRPIELSRHRLYRCPARKSQTQSSKR